MGFQTRHFTSDATSFLPWQTSTNYVVGQIVTFEKYGYICLTANTSGSSFAADLALGYWQVLNLPQIQRNYMLIGNNFEDNSVGGWQIFSTTLTSNIPTGSLTLGTAASIALTTSSSSPISGAFSLQMANTSSTNFTAGQGLISQVYNLDQIDRAKALANRFAYLVSAGASNMNFSGTSSNTFAVYIYDVTNSAWIQPAGTYNLVQTTLVGQHSGTWQVPSNMTQFRLAIVCINSTAVSTPAAGAMALNFDDFFVGSQASVMGSPVTDGTFYTPTYTGFGTVATANAAMYYRRVGDRLIVDGTVQVGTPTAVTAKLSLPSVSFDTSKISGNNNSTVVGWFASTNGTSQGFASADRFGGIAVDITDPTSVRFVDSVNSSSYIFQNGNGMIGANQWLSVHFELPISGWSSSVSMSSDTDTRVVAYQGSRNSNQSTGSAVVWNVTGTDTHGAMNTSTGVYTVPVAGLYYITFFGWLTANAAPQTGIYINGSNVQAAYCATVSNGTIAGGTVSYIGNLKTGDQITAFIGSGFTMGTTNGLSILRLSGPAVVAASEFVGAKYYASANGTANSTTPFNFDGKIYDTHNAVQTGASWRFTAPTSGYYQVSFFINDSAVPATGVVDLYKNGVLQEYVALFSSTLTTIQGVTSVQLNAGDFIELRTASSGYSWQGGAYPGPNGQSHIAIQKLSR